MQKPYLLLALLLCLNSCSKEEYLSNNDELLKDSSSTPILNEFSLENFNDPFIKNNLIVNWGQKRTINEGNEEYSTNINSKLHKAKEFIYHKYILNVKPAEKGNNRFEIVRLISSQDVENVSLVNLQTRKFTGTIISYDLLGNIIKTEVYLEGSKPDNIQNYEINTMKYAPKDDCSSGCWVMMWEERWTDFYNASSSNVSEWFYTSSRYDGQTSYYVWQSGNDYTIPPSTSTNPYHSHTDYPHGPAVAADNHPVEILKDPSILEHPCLNKVLDAVLNSNSNLVKETINQFCDNPEYNLRFKVGSCSRTDDACTNGSNVATTGEIDIIIEDTNSNPITLAQYILHEGIHAELFRFVNEYHEGTVDPNDKPGLFDLFKRYAGTEWEKEIDHIYMAEKYITPIAEALRNLDNNQYPLNYYKTFAWDGLRQWDPNNTLGVTDAEYLQYRNEVILNFNITCNEF